MKKYLLLILLFFVVGVQSMNAQGKQKLSVLYVGGSAEIETMGGIKVDSLTLAKSIKARMASFEKFLKSRFRTVKVINGKDYIPALSEQYDVTLFDGRPVPIRPAIKEYDKNGQIIRYERAAYLPDDFDRPALCIANASEDIGRSIGTKCDWFCLCLDADVHHWVKDHPIFQGPFKVNIKPEMKSTPSSAFEYAKIYNYTLPTETEMWTVQTVNFANNPNYRIGMVSRPSGFLDSPETEIISSGTCAKSIDAVAIGRHANFLHWGFSASPAYLTEAGKSALANALVYISNFAGQRVIARKLNESIATRQVAKAKIYMASKEAWQENNLLNRQFYQIMDSIRQVAQTKLKNNEVLSSSEKIYLNALMERPKEPTYSEYLKEHFPKLYHIFGDDAAEYQCYYEKNINWFHPDEEGYNLDIDEDVRTIGIANNDIRLLDACISMLEKNENAELATRVLYRYTLCRFTSPAEWRKWYNTYREKMFFTESGGWLWLINTADANVPGNDYRVLKETQETEMPELTEETDNQNPVALSATANSLPNGKKELVIRMKIHSGYHTYAQVSNKDPFLPTTVEFELPEGYKPEGAMKTPAFTQLSGSETTIYTGDGAFRQLISGTGSGEIKCTVSYQCCDNDICFPPTTKTLSVTVK